MTREEARAVAERVCTTAQTVSWTETSAHNPLWSAGDETLSIEVRWMKTGDSLRRRVQRTRTSDVVLVCWETYHTADWLEMTLARAHLRAAELVWLNKGRVKVPG